MANPKSIPRRERPSWNLPSLMLLAALLAAWAVFAKFELATAQGPPQQTDRPAGSQQPPTQQGDPYYRLASRTTPSTPPLGSTIPPAAEQPPVTPATDPGTRSQNNPGLGGNADLPRVHSLAPTFPAQNSPTPGAQPVTAAPVAESNSDSNRMANVGQPLPPTGLSKIANPFAGNSPTDDLPDRASQSQTMEQAPGVAAAPNRPGNAPVQTQNTSTFGQPPDSSPISAGAQFSSTQFSPGPQAPPQNLPQQNQAQIEQRLSPLVPNNPASPAGDATTARLRPIAESAPTVGNADTNVGFQKSKPTLPPTFPPTTMAPQSTAPVTAAPQEQFQSIEPESLVSDSNLLPSRPQVLPAAKPNLELFEPGQTMAIVGGHPIFAADLILEANQLIDQYMAGAPEKIQVQQRKLIMPKLLKKYIDTKLMFSDIEQGLPEGADVNSIFESLGGYFDKDMLPKILEQNQASDASEFDMQLRSRGSSLRQFRDRFVEDEFVKYFLKDKIDMQPEITHQEMLDYYREHESDFENHPRARWEQLFVSFTRTPDRQAAGKQIIEMGNKVVHGASFAAVARESSHDFKASEGGLQGWVNQGSLATKELDRAIFELPLDRLSDIIESDMGYHIVRVLEREPGGLTKFSEAQIEIRKKLQEIKREQSLKEYLASLRKKIPVEILVEGAESDSQGR